MQEKENSSRILLKSCHVVLLQENIEWVKFTKHVARV